MQIPRYSGWATYDMSKATASQKKKCLILYAEYHWEAEIPAHALTGFARVAGGASLRQPAPQPRLMCFVSSLAARGTLTCQESSSTSNPRGMGFAQWGQWLGEAGLHGFGPFHCPVSPVTTLERWQVLGVTDSNNPFPVPSGLEAWTSPVFVLQEPQTLTQGQEQFFKPL